MNKRIIFIDSYYFGALQNIQAKLFQGRQLTYSDSIAEVEEFGFGTGCSYVRAFRRAGWDAHLIIPNFWTLQSLWSKEHSKRTPINKFWKFMQLVSRIPILPRGLEKIPYFYSVILNQIREIQPDIVVVQDLHSLHPHFISELRKTVPLVYGEIASPLPPKRFLKNYSRIISALPSIVQYAQHNGIPSTYLPLAFDPKFAANRIFDLRENEVVFVGTFGRHQPKTIPLLKAIHQVHNNLRIYGRVDYETLKEAGLEKCYAGEVWGTDMFAVLGNTKIVINRHGSIADNYSVNMRMYEATGSGAVLITEDSVNIHELFEPNLEVCTYTSHHDAATKIKELISSPAKMFQIAKNGHQRTINSHTYDHRVSKLIEIIDSDIVNGTNLTMEN